MCVFLLLTSKLLKNVHGGVALGCRALQWGNTVSVVVQHMILLEPELGCFDNVQNILYILFTDRWSSRLYVSAIQRSHILALMSAPFLRILIVNSVNAFLARLRSKIKMSRETLNIPPVLSVVRVRHTASVLKVTPLPQMSLTTTLIKGDSYGESKILQTRTTAMELINSHFTLTVEGR